MKIIYYNLSFSFYKYAAHGTRICEKKKQSEECVVVVTFIYNDK